MRHKPENRHMLLNLNPIMKNILIKSIYLPAFMAIIGLGSCAKQTIEKDAVNGLLGSWTVDPEKSQIFDYDARNTLIACGENIRYNGEFILNNDNKGSFRISATHCDTTYTIFESIMEDFGLDYQREGRKEPYWHKYYGSYIENGDVIQFTCWAETSSVKLTENTSTIIIHLDEKHDGSKNTNQLEIYDMELVLDRN